MDYIVYDFWESYGTVGEFDTEAEARTAAKEHFENTDGECQVVVYRKRQTGYEVLA